MTQHLILINCCTFSVVILSGQLKNEQSNCKFGQTLALCPTAITSPAMYILLTVNADPKLFFLECVGDPTGLPWEEEGAEPAGLPWEEGGAEMLSLIPPLASPLFSFLDEPLPLFLWLLKKEMGLICPEE